jgi:murein DD-endopeptidase MepM/ murein hydrolase activator NlpD
MLLLPAHFKPTHQTEGLPGFPAIDCFAPAGTVVLAPLTGKVVKLSGHAPTEQAEPGGPYGWSIYLTARDGGTYYLTHFASRTRIVKLGACIGKSEPLGTVADFARATGGRTPSHIHEGLHTGPWAP